MKKHILMAGCLVFLVVPYWADSLEQTRQATEQGNAVAQTTLGMRYREG